MDKVPSVYAYLSSRQTLLAFVADVVVLIGIVQLDWNGPRVAFFYCLELEVMGLFFFIYMAMTKELGVVSFLIGFFFYSMIMSIFLFSLVYFKEMVFDLHRYPKLNLNAYFFPFYDIGIFIAIISFSQVVQLQKLMRVKSTTLVTLFEMKSILYRMVMMLLAFLGAAFLSLMTGMNTGLAPVVTFIIMKDVLEYWKFKALIELQNQTNGS